MTAPNLPKRTPTALRHFNLVEDNKTTLMTLLSFECISAPIDIVRNAYRCLAAFVHPDRFRGDHRGANRAMTKLSWAMEIFKHELHFPKWVHVHDPSRDDRSIRIALTVKFRTSANEHEEILSEHVESGWQMVDDDDDEDFRSDEGRCDQRVLRLP